MQRSGTAPPPNKTTDQADSRSSGGREFSAREGREMVAVAGWWGWVGGWVEGGRE
jgi:hypothetical protein